MINKKYLVFLFLSNIFILNSCLGLVAKSARSIENFSRKSTSQALSNKLEISIQETQTVQSEFLIEYEKTAAAKNEERIKEKKEEFKKITHNLTTLINYNHLFNFDKDRLLMRMSVGVDCRDFYKNVPFSNSSDNLEERIFSILKVFDQYSGITIYELSPPIDQNHIGYQIDFMDYDENDNNNSGLVLIYEKSEDRFYYADVDCWLN